MGVSAKSFFIFFHLLSNDDVRSFSLPLPFSPSLSLESARQSRCTVRRRHTENPSRLLATTFEDVGLEGK